MNRFLIEKGHEKCEVLLMSFASLLLNRGLVEPKSRALIHNGQTDPFLVLRRQQSCDALVNQKLLPPRD